MLHSNWALDAIQEAALKKAREEVLQTADQQLLFFGVSLGRLRRIIHVFRAVFGKSPVEMTEDEFVRALSVVARSQDRGLSAGLHRCYQEMWHGREETS